jgi:hypothetical protein
MTDKVSYKEIYQAIKHKMEFGQVSRKDLVKRIIRKNYFVFFRALVYFLCILEVYTNFWKI